MLPRHFIDHRYSSKPPKRSSAFRYTAARSILEQVLTLEPSHIEGRIQLGLVLERLGNTLLAEDQMRSLIRDHGDNPWAAHRLGHVYRNLWSLYWRTPDPAEKDPEPDDQQKLRTRLQRAVESRSLMNLAGFNAALLVALYKGIRKQLLDAKGSVPPISNDQISAEWFSTDSGKLIAEVRLQTEAARRRATALGDAEELFWTTTSLSGLALLEGQREDSLIRDACALPQTTAFQMEALKTRLTLLRDLNFNREFAEKAIEIINESKNRLAPSCKQVVLFYCDKPGPNLKSLEQRVQEILGTMSFAGSHCMLSSLSAEDLLFADLCLAREAKVNFLVFKPTPNDLNGELWPWNRDESAERLRQLACKKDRVKFLFHAAELGEPPNAHTAKRRHNRWVMNTARLLIDEGDEDASLHAVVVTKGDHREKKDEAVNEETAADFIGEARNAQNFRGRVTVIRTDELNSWAVP